MFQNLQMTLYITFLSRCTVQHKKCHQKLSVLSEKIFEAVDQAEAALLNPPVSTASISSLTPSNSTMDDTRTVNIENHQHLVHYINNFPGSISDL
jgi:hypothetical protein